MGKATRNQINKLKELEIKARTTNLSEFRAICSHFLQLLKDIDFTSQFSSDFSSKLIRFDYNSDKGYIASELRELMKSAIDYHEDNL
tara:strand:- start:2128 stop:2388 length:261 start_codon:yes stop_codon:yes gene_type:complete